MFTDLMESVESGKIFEAKRIAIGKTQQQVANEIGVSQKTIQNIEGGKTRTIRLGKRLAYAKAIGIPFEEMQSLMAESDIEELGPFKMADKMIQELIDFEKTGKIPSRETQDVFDAINQRIKEKQKSQRGGSMKGN